MLSCKYRPLSFKKRIAFTHKKCSDGLMSAYVLEKTFGNNIEIYYVSHGNEDYVDKKLQCIRNGQDYEVFFVDITFSKRLHLFVDSAFGRQIIIDHHISAKNRLSRFINHFVFSNDMSAANVAYHYFSDLIFDKVEYKYINLLSTVNRVDLGDFSNLQDLQIYTMLEMCSNTCDLKRMMEDLNGNLSSHGKWIKENKEKNAEMISNQGNHVRINGKLGFIVNSPAYIMEICNNLLRKHPRADFVGCYWIRGNQVQFSLRTEEHRNCDVSEIACSYGGGGHKCASGFSVDKIKARNILS